MKKILFMILLLFMPLFVYADNCNQNDIKITSINLLETSDDVVVLNDTSISDNNSININLKFKELNDNAKYKITIKNNSNEDYELSENSIGYPSEYISYKIESSDNSNIVKAGTTKEAILTIEYSKPVPSTMYTGNKYNESKTVTIDLSTGNDVVNPKTGNNSYTFLLIMIIVAFSIIFMMLNKNNIFNYCVLILLLVIPLGVNALCKIELKLISNIEIEKGEDIAFLMGGTKTDSGTNYLRTNVTKDSIEKIIFVNSLDGYTIDNNKCFDVSLNEDGRVIGCFKDTDDNGLYEMTIASKGKVYASSGEYLFMPLTNLKTIEGMEYFDTSYVTNMESMFDGTQRLTSLDLSHFDTSNVTNMSNMFRLPYIGSGSIDVLETLDCSSFDTSNVTNMSSMFEEHRNLIHLNVSSFNTSKVTDMSGMFSGCYTVISIDVSHFDTSKVTNMSKMFKECLSLSTIDLSHFDTSKVTDMSYMFYCLRVHALNVTNFITTNVINMSGMFCNIAGLESLDVSNFNTSKVTNMSEMFEGCSKLETLNLSNFDTSIVTNMNKMFLECQKLRTLDVSHFDTSSVIDMSNMFMDCYSLVTLDLSSFDTSKVTNMSEMFRSYNNSTTFSHLTTIYVSDKFVVINVDDSSNMFNGCTKLVGGEGTTFSSSHTNKAYAHIDGGSSNPGYFTLKSS